MNMQNGLPVYAGSNDTLLNKNTPQRSDAANAIIKEAMRTDNRSAVAAHTQPADRNIPERSLLPLKHQILNTT